MHDPEYYRTYAERWQKEYEAQIRALEKNRKGFEGAGANGEDAKEVKASQLADAARAAREEKKALTDRAGREVDRPMPKVALNPTKMTGVARSRHQLHSLLADAFMNREAIEEKIAQGKRNRKEAGNKYGTSFLLLYARESDHSHCRILILSVQSLDCIRICQLHRSGNDRLVTLVSRHVLASRGRESSYSMHLLYHAVKGPVSTSRYGISNLPTHRYPPVKVTVGSYFRWNTPT